MSIHDPLPKIYVSYQGGCAGDMITACLNGIAVKLAPRGNVADQGFSIKSHEPLQDREHLLAVSNRSYRFLSTHEFSLLKMSGVQWINLVVKDLKIQEILILRQMTLQKLRIVVDHDSHWFRIVRTFCMKGRHETAAEYWLSRARSIWLKSMEHRLTLNDSAVQQIAVDVLFDPAFASELQTYVPEIDLTLAKLNHSQWLHKNSIQRWNLKDTLAAMTRALQSMDWHQCTGTIYSNDYVT